MEVRRLTDHALGLDHEPVGADGLQHVEHSIITGSALHVTMGESPEVVTFREGPSGVFNADANSPMPMQIRAGVEGDRLTCAWHWAPPGEESREQSRATAHFEHELAPRAPRHQDIGALIGLLATLEGELMGSATSFRSGPSTSPDGWSATALLAVRPADMYVRPSTT